jgi:hypothetical protein
MRKPVIPNGTQWNEPACRKQGISSSCHYHIVILEKWILSQDDGNNDF